MSDEFCGRLFLLAVEDPDNPGDFLAIAGLKSNSLTINNEQVDTTAKDDAPWRRLANCGIRSMSVAGSGKATSDASFQRIQDLALSGEIVLYRITSDRGDQFEGKFQVASFERSGDVNNEEQFTGSFESSEEITYTEPAPTP